RVAVLAGVQVDHEVDQRTLESRTPPRVEREAAAGYLCAARQVEQSELLGDLPVRPGRGRPCLLATLAHHPVRLLAAGRNGILRQVRNREQRVTDRVLQLAPLLLLCGHAVTQLPHLPDERLRFLVTAGLLELADLRRDFVTAGAQAADLGVDRGSRLGPWPRLVDQPAVVGTGAPAQSLAAPIRLFPYSPDIKLWSLSRDTRSRLSQYGWRTITNSPEPSA